MATKTKTQAIEIPPINPKLVTFTIVGVTDLVLNKMDDTTTDDLTTVRNGGAKNLGKPNEWYKRVTSIHWLYGKPDLDPSEYTEETMEQMLKENVPCISAFGFKEQMKKAVVRNKIETYSTGFAANVNVVPKANMLIPIKFSEHYIDSMLMFPKKQPVLANLNRFTGWSAEITLSYMDNVYSLPSILNIVNLTGFGLGIGSGTKCGYGRFRIKEDEPIIEG